jgi:hypothetical protein
MVGAPKLCSEWSGTLSKIVWWVAAKHTDLVVGAGGQSRGSESGVRVGGESKVSDPAAAIRYTRGQSNDSDSESTV